LKWQTAAKSKTEIASVSTNAVGGSIYYAGVVRFKNSKIDRFFLLEN